MFLESLDAVIGQLKTVDNVNLFLSDLRYKVSSSYVMTGLSSCYRLIVQRRRRNTNDVSRLVWKAFTVCHLRLCVSKLTLS